MGLKRFLRFLNSERGQLPASEAARFGRAEESFVQAPGGGGGGGQLFRVLNPALSITETATPSVGAILIDDFGLPFARFKGFFGGEPIPPESLTAGEISSITDLMRGGGGGGGRGGGGGGVSRSTSFNVSEIGPIAAQIQREELALQERRIRQETAITQLQAQIEIGEIDINTALTQYDQFLTGQRLRLDASEFAVAPGTQFAPGFAPGGIGSQVAESAGLTPSAGVAPITPVTISSGTPPAITPLADQPNIQQAFEALKNFGA